MGMITEKGKYWCLKGCLNIGASPSSSYSNYGNSHIYLGYSSTEPTIAGSNVTENPNLARIEITYALAFVGSNDYRVTNDRDLVTIVKEQFDTLDNPTLNYVCLFDTSGHLLFYQQLDEPITLAVNTGIITRANQLNINILNNTAV